jgi:phage tail-like protein
MPRQDPLTQFLFGFQITGSDDLLIPLDYADGTAFFQSISGLSVTAQVTPQPEGGVTAFLRQIIGPTSHKNIIMKQGFTGDEKILRWVRTPMRVNAVIVMLGPKMEVKAKWEIRNCVPVKWQGPNFDAGQNALAIETLEIAHEGFGAAEPQRAEPAPAVNPTPPPSEATVNFPSDGSKVGPNPKLDAMANDLKNNKDKQVKIQGHTDTDGAHGYNVSLSQKRADAVKQHLISSGVDPGQIVLCQGYGPDHPIASNATASGKAQNRRTTVKDVNAADDWTA